MKAARNRQTDADLPLLFNLDTFEPTNPEPAHPIETPAAINVPVAAIPVPAPATATPKPKETATPKTAATTKKKKPAIVKAAIPDEFEPMRRELQGHAKNNDLAAIMDMMGTSSVTVGYGWAHEYKPKYRTKGTPTILSRPDNNWNRHLKPWRMETFHLEFEEPNERHAPTGGTTYMEMLYADSELTVKHIKMYVTYRERGDNEIEITQIALDNWKPVTKFMPKARFIQSEETIRNILKKKRPWVINWLDDTTKHFSQWDARRYMMAPWLETLQKAGYRFATEIISNENGRDEAYTEKVNRLCTFGTNPKTIFKATKAVYTTLKEEDNMETWDLFRKMTKTGKITDNLVPEIYQSGLGLKNLENASEILGKRYNGKPIFNWTSLLAYLRRLDTYEAIDQTEALMLLKDYLSMCNKLEMEPRIDGDSLKREHDIAARLVRQQRDEIIAREMKEREEKEKAILKHAEYHENIYFIRPITDYDDLMDEATQQHNCVACYANSIANGTTRIFTMRETAHPERSLITIETTPDLKTIKQKYLARNQVIRNRSQSEFIERWHKHCKQPIPDITEVTDVQQIPETTAAAA